MWVEFVVGSRLADGFSPGSQVFLDDKSLPKTEIFKFQFDQSRGLT